MTEPGKLRLTLPRDFPPRHECLPHAAMSLGAGRFAGLLPAGQSIRQLIIEAQPTGGWALYRLDAGGGFAGDTYHDTRDDALDQARREFGAPLINALLQGKPAPNEAI